MSTIYVPAGGRRVPMPGHQPDWPEEGRPVNFASAYEARLVKDGDLVVKQKPKKPVKAGDTDGAQGGTT